MMSSSESSPVTAHVLDTVSGKPAQGIVVAISGTDGTSMGYDTTNENGRCNTLLEGFVQNRPAEGTYKVRFHTGEYWEKNGVAPFHPFVDVWFNIQNSKEHYHIPLLITPASYTTYRGS